MAQADGLRIIFVGDTGAYLSTEARRLDSAATLITGENFQNLPSGTYYTSVGDLDNLLQFGIVIQQANTIIYCPPPDGWSDTTASNTSVMKSWTEEYLKLASYDPGISVQGFDFDRPTIYKDQMLELKDHRRGDDPQIWIVGCSVSHGSKISKDLRYGELISKNLGMPCSFLAKGATSITWAADQILRSDIRPGDIIFWGLTSINRISYWDEESHQMRFLNHGVFDLPEHKSITTLVRKNILASEILLQQGLTAVYQVYNYCTRLGVKLVIGSIFRGLEEYLKDLPCHIPLDGFFGPGQLDRYIDFGRDNMHPGPLTHQFYADRMLAHYHRIYKE